MYRLGLEIPTSLTMSLCCSTVAFGGKVRCIPASSWSVVDVLLCGENRNRAIHLFILFISLLLLIYRQEYSVV